jgi:GntR family transcriptional regulator/MocR family aminotransferase
MPKTQTNPSVGSRPQGDEGGPDNWNLAWETMLDLSGTRPGPLHMRLAAAIRSAVRDGRLPLGAALPPSRVLAARLGISRWTVTQAYGQLTTEGYLSGRTGSATRVSWTPGPADDAYEPRALSRPTLARPARYDLWTCGPDLRAFPRRKWVEAIRAAAETAPFDQLDRAAPGGLPVLRAVLAEHLNRSRGAAAEASSISVFSGAGQAFTQLCRALLAAGHTAIGIEQPGSPRFFQAARTAGLDMVALPADEHGLVVDALPDHPGLRAISVGAARQVGFGCPLAPERRPALLDWARRADVLIVEDDYDAELSYDGPTPAVLQGTDPHRVALLGSMSQAIGPAVSIGWVVTPRRWVQPVRAEQELQTLPPALNQLALVELMRSGAYDRHMRASRLMYRARRNALVAALRRWLPQYPVHGAGSGLEIMLALPPGTDVAGIVAAAARRDVNIGNLDELRFTPDLSAPGLMIGYGNLRDSVIDEAIALLADVLRGQLNQAEAS